MLLDPSEVTLAPDWLSSDSEAASDSLPVAPDCPSGTSIQWRPPVTKLSAELAKNAGVHGKVLGG